MTRRGIHSEDVLTALGSRGRRVVSAKALLAEVGGGRHQLKELRRALRSLMADGRVERFQGGYRVSRDDGLQEGTFQRARGGAQVVLGSGDVLAVPDDEAVGGAEDGNTVLVHVRGDEPRSAWVIHVLSPTRSEWVGILDRDPTGGFVTPYRDDATWGIRVARGDLGGAGDGDVVVVDLQKRRRGPARGRVVEVLGPPGSPEADFRAVVWHRRLPTVFPEAALREAEACPERLDAREARRRTDLRDKAFVTIDPETARDHDDAVCVEARGKGAHVTLWVAIADVAHYVAEGSALDAEALQRGNSVYFPDRAIPMLPERLSGGLCSLRPDEDRFAMVVELGVDERGAITRTAFHRGVMRSRARLTYEQAAAAIDGAAPDGMAPETAQQVRALADVTRRLRRRRFAAGCIDFELPAGRVVLDAAGMPVDVVLEERNEAHRAIEDAMLAANRAVATALGEAGLPALYRVHEPPSPGDLEGLCETLQSFGLLEKRRDASQLGPGDVARALARAAGRPEERLVNTVALRAMRRARYGERDLGHYALGFDSYTHFTSPIRRYADLVVHRALNRLLDGTGTAPRARSADLTALAARVSMRERVAEAAERDMVALKKCAFMAKHLGEELDGTVTGVARHGFYVTLERWFVEGLVHVATLSGYAVLDEKAHALVVRGSGQRWRLGDRVRVVVDSVDRAKAWVNFALAGGRGR